MPQHIVTQLPQLIFLVSVTHGYRYSRKESQHQSQNTTFHINIHFIVIVNSGSNHLTVTLKMGVKPPDWGYLESLTPDSLEEEELDKVSIIVPSIVMFICKIL